MGFIRKFKKFTLRIIATANILVVAMLCATGYAGYIDPTAHPSCEVLTLAFPIPLLLNLGFLLFWLVFHYKYAWIPIAGFLVCASPVRTYCPFNFGKDAPSDGVKVMSFNAHVFNYINNGKDLPNTAVDYVCNSGADIVCLQEASVQRNKERLKAQLKAVYPYKEDERDKNRELISVYSKYPIIRHEVVNLCGKRNLCGAFYIDMGTDTLLVINCHFEATRLSDEERDEFGKFVKRNPQTPGHRTKAHPTSQGCIGLYQAAEDEKRGALRRLQRLAAVVCPPSAGKRIDRLPYRHCHWSRIHPSGPRHAGAHRQHHVFAKPGTFRLQSRL